MPKKEHYKMLHCLNLMKENKLSVKASNGIEKKLDQILSNVRKRQINKSHNVLLSKLSMETVKNESVHDDNGHPRMQIVSYQAPSYSSESMFVPRNSKQEEYLALLLKHKPDIVFAIGPAGTSKTYGATLVGIEKLMKKEIDRLVITRPAVSADEELGYLKGDLEDKMKPWLLPIFDTLRLYMSNDEIDVLMKSQKIEICSLAHMRGRTFHNCYVIVDESQNTTPSQMLMLLTRIGDNSKFIFTGDIQQHDRKAKQSGLIDFMMRFSQFHNELKHDDFSERIQMIVFDAQHVERHPVIPFILKLYNE